MCNVKEIKVGDILANYVPWGSSTYNNNKCNFFKVLKINERTVILTNIAPIKYTCVFEIHIDRLKDDDNLGNNPLLEGVL